MFDEIEKYINKNKNKNKSHKELYLDLITNFNNEIEIINFIMYDKYNYVHNDNDNDKEELFEEKVKRLDSNFKKHVKDYYKKCIVTGRSSILCEAAHIHPFCKSKIEDKYNPNNGIYLCSDLHKLYDRNNNEMIITPNFKLILSDEILNDVEMSDYHKYHNKILDIKPASKKYFEMIC
jgi:hypothetical protein